MHRIHFIILLLIFSGFLVRGQRPENSDLVLMPWPQDLQRNEGHFVVMPDFRVQIAVQAGDETRIFDASTRFLRQLADRSGVFIDAGFPETDGPGKAALQIRVGQVANLDLNTDESYRLLVRPEGISIEANTDVGAMRALSTLLQLLSTEKGSYAFPAVEITDAPRFAWRGLMLDAARHFMPVEVVKRNLDAMAYVKLNVLHWHLSDDQGFRVEVRSLPKLHERASDGQYYSQEQIWDVVSYAQARGIRVVPEFDVPGHATAFVTAYPQLASNRDINYGLERYSGIFDPTLDPTREETYAFLETLFAEMAPLFPDPYFHIGGDENAGRHWDASERIQQFMRDNGLRDNHELQTYFNIKLEKILSRYGKSLMGWEEIMTANMPKTALIHSWRGVNEGLQPGESLIQAVKNGYKTVLSNGYYIDLMQPAWQHYIVDPMPDADLTEMQQTSILGGEATMWSELVTPLTVDSRIWPRTAAIAERFWSPAEIRDIDWMYERLDRISQNLEGFGIRHLQAREYILRNIANYQDTEALEKLAGVSEPFKIYTRNAGGTQYKSFSPFTLFADACTADARDARPFHNMVKGYVESGEQAHADGITAYLTQWSKIRPALEKTSERAPLVHRILPYATRLHEVSGLLLNGMEKGALTEVEHASIESHLFGQENPSLNLDVELAVAGDLKALADFLRKKNN